MNIGYSIKTYRKAKGLKQKDLANNCTITQAYLSQIESGNKTPSPTTLNHISKALNIPLPVLLFKALDESDVKAEKKHVFKTIKPGINAMLDQLF
jgi:XRE family transcriptional regulator, regulator of sulfur utilization